jgi:hypothetical protein
MIDCRTHSAAFSRVNSPSIHTQIETKKNKQCMAETKFFRSYLDDFCREKVAIEGGSAWHIIIRKKACIV